MKNISIFMVQLKSLHIVTAIFICTVCLFASDARVNAENDFVKSSVDNVEFIYNSAVALFKNKLYRQAQESFLKVKKFSPGYKSTDDYLNRIDSMFEGRDNSKIVRYLYRDATHLYRQKEYLLAQQKFFEVQARDKGYKSTERYLEKISIKLAFEEKMKMAASQDQSNTAKLAQGEEAIISEIEKIVQDKFVKEQELARMTQYKDEAEEKYKQAIKCYKDGKYIDSKIRFIQVQAILPNYKNTLEYLGKLDDDIARKRDDQIEADPADIAISGQSVSQKDNIRHHYSRAVKLYQAREYHQAQTMFDEIDRKVPDYKSIRKYMERIESKLFKLADQKMKETHLQQIFDEAVALYKNKFYQDAKLKFEEVLKQNSKNRLARKHVKKINNILMRKKKNGGIKKFVKMREDEKVINTSDSVVVKNLDLKGVYRNAVKQYRRNNFDEAKGLFMSVMVIDPDYKATQNYLRKINERIILEYQDWKKDYDERVATIKAKEEDMGKLRGEEYEEFRAQLEAEWKTLNRVLRDRKRRVEKQKKKFTPG